MRITGSENIARQVRGEGVRVEYTGLRRLANRGIAASFTFAIDCGISAPDCGIDRKNYAEAARMLSAQDNYIYIYALENSRLCLTFNRSFRTIGTAIFLIESASVVSGKLVLTCFCTPPNNPNAFADIINSTKFRVALYKTYHCTYNLEIFEEDETD